MTTTMEESPNIGWIAGTAIVLAVLAVGASLWIYYH
jgi:hypothetical protein